MQLSGIYVAWGGLSHAYVSEVGLIAMVKYEMLSLAVKYGLNDVREGLPTIKDAVWSCFVQKVQL